MKRLLRSKVVLTLAAFLMIAAAVVIPLSGSILHSHAASSAPPVSIGSIQGTFYHNPNNSGQFDPSILSSPVFSQKFPVIDFDPPASAQVSCSNATGVDENTRPFTDVVPNANGTCSTIVAQDPNNPSTQAGEGDLSMFQATFTANLTLANAGDVTFNFFSDDGWILASGPEASHPSAQPSYVSGSLVNAPSKGYITNFPIVGSFNQPSSPAQNTVTVHFPVSGTFPIEIDYTECCGGPTTLVLGTSFGNPIPPPPPPPSPTPTPKHQTLFVLLQGINSRLSGSEAAANGGMGMVDAFWASLRTGPHGSFAIPGIVPFLQTNGFSGAQYLVYSYLDSHGNGNPEPYDCTNTFTSPISGTKPIAAYAVRLGRQINAALTNNPALKGKPTDVYLIGHSLGGVVAISYLTALYKTTGVVPALPAGDALKGVVTLDSPIGGVSDDPAYFDFAAFVYKGCVSRKQLESVRNLVDIFKTTSKPTHPPTDDGNPGSQGAHASILKAIFSGPAETNQGVVLDALTHGTSVLTIGNYIDFSWNSAPCNTILNRKLTGIPPIPRVTFLGTQWIDDEGPADATKEHRAPLTAYGRAFTAGVSFCAIEITGGLFTANHLVVLNDTDVESALKQFLPNGGVPKALDVATPEP